ncbi:MAG: hypothetical protein ACPHNW_11595 [Pseudoalteromonas tetraodonis]
MSARLMAIVWLTSSLVFLSGCEITNTQTQGESALNVPSQPDKKTNQPNPKPRPKSEPIYPSAAQVIAWHANQCGGFKLAPDNETYLGEQALKAFFNTACVNLSRDPDTVMSQLLKLDQAYYWPDDIKHYLWLQKQHVLMQIDAKKQQQALNAKMQKTLSSLAAIEQQLLLREETKEQ